jgi:cytochrome c-type biogenesis protein CcmH/NrfG
MRPLVNVSYAVDRAVWAPEPFGFHLTNVLLHMLNVLLVFQLARRSATDRTWRGAAQTGTKIQPDVVALVAALLFAVHPMMTEAVGYVSARPELLCSSFFLLAVFAARRWMLHAGNRWWLGALGLWSLALASKEIALTLPVVLLAYDRFILAGDRTEARRRLTKLHFPFLLVAGLVSALRFVVFGFEYAGESMPDWRLALVEVDVIRQYVVLMLMPIGQTIFHAVSPVKTLLGAALALATVGSLAALGWWTKRVDGLITLGCCWFVILLMPSSFLFALNRGEPMAEHRIYLASVGLFLVAGSAAGWLMAFLADVTARSRLLARISFALIVLWLSAHTLLRNVVWGDPITLWAEAVQKAPDHWVPRVLLGEALRNDGRCDLAITQFGVALARHPEDTAIYTDLGGCLIQVGQLKEASTVFSKLRERYPQLADGSTGLGAIAMTVGSHDQARQFFLEALGRDPSNVRARRLLARLEESDNPAEALRLCEEIDRLAPRVPGNEDCIRRNRARLGLQPN